mmetsp:Transcript_29649/g.40940  ORF Transcript_29649/g.40940 Transcript_29649/m.40940 type:complete len:232 (+) Transcript_29649:98-793(+)
MMLAVSVACQSHRKMQLDSEWSALQRKMTGREPGYGLTAVTVLFALTPVPADPVHEDRLRADMDHACKLPVEKEGPGLMCVGSLDVNITDVFVSEELKPLQMSSEGEGRAYLSNVCVGSGVRRQGLARLLIEEAESLCQRKGIQQLYVHVVPSNEAAFYLYTKCGFVIETEETGDFAYNRDRERRVLLFKRVAPKSVEQPSLVMSSPESSSEKVNNEEDEDNDEDFYDFCI